MRSNGIGISLGLRTPDEEKERQRSYQLGQRFMLEARSRRVQQTMGITLPTVTDAISIAPSTITITAATKLIPTIQSVSTLIQLPTLNTTIETPMPLSWSQSPPLLNQNITQSAQTITSLLPLSTIGTTIKAVDQNTISDRPIAKSISKKEVRKLTAVGRLLKKQSEQQPQHHHQFNLMAGLQQQYQEKQLQHTYQVQQLQQLHQLNQQLQLDQVQVRRFIFVLCN